MLWNGGNDTQFDTKQLIEELKSYISEGFCLYIGADSHFVSNKCVFATAICLHHPINRDGVVYFWKRERFHREKYSQLSKRLLEEANFALQTAILLNSYLPNAKIELHFDISPEKKNKSSKFVDIITKFALGCGYKCQIKPYSWAASSAADWHCR